MNEHRYLDSLDDDYSFEPGPDARTIEVIALAADAGKRLDVFVGAIPEVETRSRATRYIEEGLVLVNGVLQAKKYLLQEGDDVRITIPPPRSSHLEPEYIPLDIRFEDDEIIVLSKEAGMVVHPAPGHYSGTLVNALLAHSLELGKLQGGDRPGIVHRLDMDTSGLMLVGKTDRAQSRLQDAIRERAVDRRYLALVHGWIAPETGIIDAPIGRAPGDKLRMKISDSEKAKEAQTTFKVIERFEPGRYDDGFTLLECKLFTGRTHQIRVHMRYIGHPIVGDPAYGRGTLPANHYLQRQFLHSYKIRFTHPISGEEMHFEDDLPEDLQGIINELDPR
ncbi:MAG: RluA family pseudouridine synthase [Coriobacteriia bacterium]|nr:RluA family pseudouridine synthase [Coriobacteriia bacterium]MCL2537042.1 RluA family pseudouridine synthase [Coriobacteriia bacterium]